MQKFGLLERVVLGGSAFVAIAMWVASSSRLLAPFVSLGATLGPACLILSAISGIIFIKNAPAFLLYVLVSCLTLAGFYWVRVFTQLGSFNTHWINGFVLGGLYCCIAFYAIKRFRGVDGPIRLLINLSTVVVITYLLFSLALIGGVEVFQTRGTAVLYDNVRGYRIYLASGLCALLLGASIRYARTRNAPIAVVGILMSVSALYLSHSRFAQAACAVVVLVGFLPNLLRRLVVVGAAIAPIMMLGVWWVNSNLLLGFMAGDESLDIRSQALTLSQKLFLDHPFSGIGIEAEPGDLLTIYRFPFSPSDIGPAGVATEFGILGLLLFMFILWNLMTFSLRAYSVQGSKLEKCLADAAVFSLLYSIISPSVLIGDCSLIAGCVLALNFSRTKKANPRTTQPAAALSEAESGRRAEAI